MIRVSVWLTGIFLMLPISAMDRGEYLARGAGCVHCHTAENEAPLAGGRAFETPFGTVYSPNISPSAQGLAGWTAEQFRAAVQQGVAPDGTAYYPVFPYTSYRGMRVEDVNLIWDYLRQQMPQKQENKPAQMMLVFRSRTLLMLWQTFYLDPPAPTSAMQDRGRYWVEHVSHCGECHSPRDVLGAIRPRKQYTGAQLPNGHRAPPLLSTVAGLSAWDASDLAEYLYNGRSDYTHKARDEMHDFIQCCTAHLSEEDRSAMAHYLKARPIPAYVPRHGPRHH